MKIMIRIIKEITKEEYERGLIVVQFVSNLYEYEIINEKEMHELIDFYADKYGKEEREKRKNSKKKDK